MKTSELLFEGRNTKIILVDFQPAYDRATSRYTKALGNAIDYLNRYQPSNVIIFFNGDEVGIEDKDYDVKEHYIEYGLDVDIIDNFQMREKGYGFFRTWMDHGVEPALIIKIIRYMVMSRINDSREISEEDMVQLIGEYNYEQYGYFMEGDPIYLPDISIAELKTFSGTLIGGGGEHECLREIQILMNAFNIRYKAVQDWIY